jgi:hypothetical protein
MEHLDDELKVILSLIVMEFGGKVVISYEAFQEFMQEDRVLTAEYDAGSDSIILRVEVAEQ